MSFLCARAMPIRLLGALCTLAILSGCFEATGESAKSIQQELGGGTNPLKQGMYRIISDQEITEVNLLFSKSKSEGYYYTEDDPGTKLFLFHLAENIYLLQAPAMMDGNFIYMVYFHEGNGGTAIIPECDKLPTRLKKKLYGEEHILRCRVDSADEVISLIKSTDMSASTRVSIERIR